LRAKEGITRLRGRWHRVETEGAILPALATLHPAYLLRSPSAKREAWSDLVLLRRTLDGAVTAE
jgi:DNA polymerase